MINLEIGKTYVIRVKVLNKMLTYTGEILNFDNDFITFKDKYNNKITYKKEYIINFEELI